MMMPPFLECISGANSRQEEIKAEFFFKKKRTAEGIHLSLTYIPGPPPPSPKSPGPIYHQATAASSPRLQGDS